MNLGKGEGGCHLYSRGQGADVFVATEGQADCGEGSALVEHLCYLGRQVASGSHEHLPEVAGPGGRLLLRSSRRESHQVHGSSLPVTTPHPQRDKTASRPEGEIAHPLGKGAEKTTASKEPALLSAVQGQRASSKGQPAKGSQRRRAHTGPLTNPPLELFFFFTPPGYL